MQERGGALSLGGRLPTPSTVVRFGGIVQGSGKVGFQSCSAPRPSSAGHVCLASFQCETICHPPDRADRGP